MDYPLNVVYKNKQGSQEWVVNKPDANLFCYYIQMFEFSIFLYLFLSSCDIYVAVWLINLIMI